jgi:spore coat protein U-like protein
MKRLLLILTVFTAVLAFAVAAYAVELSDWDFDVTANVVPTCTVETQDINFGDYGGLAVEAQGSVDVTCITGLDYEVGLGIGLYGTVGRQMQGGDTTGTALLNYAIYQNDTLSIEWGDDCLSSPTFGSEICAGPFVGDGTPNILTTWGQIPASQNVETGGYADVVDVTIVY